MKANELPIIDCLKTKRLLLKHSLVSTECLMYSNIKVEFYSNNVVSTEKTDHTDRNCNEVF